MFEANWKLFCRPLSANSNLYSSPFLLQILTPDTAQRYSICTPLGSPVATPFASPRGDDVTADLAQATGKAISTAFEERETAIRETEVALMERDLELQEKERALGEVLNSLNEREDELEIREAALKKKHLELQKMEKLHNEREDELKILREGEKGDELLTFHFNDSRGNSVCSCKVPHRLIGDSDKAVVTSIRSAIGESLGCRFRPFSLVFESPSGTKYHYESDSEEEQLPREIKILLLQALSLTRGAIVTATIYAKEFVAGDFRIRVGDAFCFQSPTRLVAVGALYTKYPEFSNPKYTVAGSPEHVHCLKTCKYYIAEAIDIEALADGESREVILRFVGIAGGDRGNCTQKTQFFGEESKFGTHSMFRDHLGLIKLQTKRS